MHKGVEVTRHPNIDPDDLQKIRGERLNHLLSPKAIQFIRKQQLLHRQQTGQPLTNKFYLPKDNPELQWPVFIGEKGEPIVLYQKNALGSGSFGEVFLGFNLDTEKLHAIKVQRPQSSEEKIKIKEEEAVLEGMERLVDTVEGVLDGEFVSIGAQTLAWGVDLSTSTGFYRASEGLPPHSDEEKLDRAISMLEKIHEFHQQKKIHRDIKVDNTKWDDEKKEAKLLDVGDAKDVGENGVFSENELRGTPHCIAPEVLKQSTQGEPIDYSVRTDMFSAGVSVAEIFSSKDLTIDRNEFYTERVYGETSVDSGIPPFLQKRATDIFNNSENPLQNKMNECVKQMTDMDPNVRPDFPEAIAKLKQIRSEIQQAKRAEKAPSITMEEQNQENKDPPSLEGEFHFTNEELNKAAKFLEENFYLPAIEEKTEIEDKRRSRASLGEEDVKQSEVSKPENLVEPSKEKDEQVNKTKDNLEEMAKKLDEYIGTLVKEVKSEGKIIGMIRKHGPLIDKQKTINEATKLYQKIQEIKGKSPIETRDLIDLSGELIKVRGENYARHLSNITDIRKGSKGRFDEILNNAGKTLEAQLRDTKEYQFLIASRPQEKPKKTK
ncbi:MAG: hypothetical protein BGO43_05385 [Gammaproteobacteria bacterium 39-13]|nr:protein kinase [Gammaproteobacteria bacterium]OJV96272.1 MAG: hypothetical protein BGO43_05385 [Gammaproteobacteria bacterium 39-13]